MALKTERAKIESDGRKQFEGIKPADLLIPILSIIVFILLLIFVFIPLVNDGINMRDEIKEVQRKQSQMSALDETLKKTNNTKLQADLNDAREVIPETLKVSEFAFYIDTLAQGKGLTFKEISSSNVEIDNSTENQAFTNGDSSYFGVTGPLVYAGSYDQIIAFLDELQVTSPYIVSLSEIKLTNETSDASSSASWNVEINATGYFLAASSAANINIYAPYQSYSDFEDVVEIFNNKAERID